MALKTVHDDVLDGAFNILNDADLMLACSSDPVSRADAVSSDCGLADIAMAASDYVPADAAGGGRQCTVGAKAGVTVDQTATATVIALVDATRILYTTTCTSQALTAGNTVDFPAWIVTIGDPT